MKQFNLFIPFLILLFVVAFLWRGLSLHPNVVPSPLMNKPAPQIHLPNLLNENITTSNDFLGHITLVNVWATWCYACAIEHDFLLQLSQKAEVLLYGLNYKDDPALAKKWLEDNGNPYQFVAVDQTGKAAIDWGVYGTPETFVLDKKGIIRYKIIGPINKKNWEQEIAPIIEKLRSET